MRPEHLEEMDSALSRWQGKANVLDVGSLDVNGTFRPLVEHRGWQYTGLDLTEGPNVDVVSGDPYRYPFESRAFDVVISGSVMEHVQAIWIWMPELVRLLRKGGLLAIITHTQWKYHPHPFDCWRIMPDGMGYLFDLDGRLRDYDIRMFNEHDIIGAAWRRS
jgi:SAM-dependent methyltransferase